MDKVDVGGEAMHSIPLIHNRQIHILKIIKIKKKNYAYCGRHWNNDLGNVLRSYYIEFINI